MVVLSSLFKNPELRIYVSHEYFFIVIYIENVENKNFFNANNRHVVVIFN